MRRAQVPDPYGLHLQPEQDLKPMRELALVPLHRREGLSCDWAPCEGLAPQFLNRNLLQSLATTSEAAKDSWAEAAAPSPCAASIDLIEALHSLLIFMRASFHYKNNIRLDIHRELQNSTLCNSGCKGMEGNMVTSEQLDQKLTEMIKNFGIPCCFLASAPCSSCLPFSTSSKL